MQTLSKDAEQQIIEAAKSAVDLVDNQSLTPTDAVEKLAREHDFQPDKIRFLSHAYNTGRQTAQREVSDSALDKFAEFPLADAEEVIGRIWPKEVKTASDVAYGQVSDEYARKPAWLTVRGVEQKNAQIKAASDRLRPLLVKQADNCQTCHKPTTECVCPKKMSLDQAIKEGNRLKQAAEQSRHDAAVAYEQLVGRMGQLADYFRKFARDREELAYVDLAARTYFGDHGTALMDWVYERNRMSKTADSLGNRFGPKVTRANDLVKFASNRVIDWTTKPWSHLSTCIELAQTVNEKRAAEGVARDAAVKHANEVLLPFVAAPSNSLTTWSLLDVGASATRVKSGNFGFLADTATLGQQTKGLLDKALGGTNDAVDKQWEELEDPQHDAQLRQIRTQAMLSDLMNDDVIGSYDPETVLNKYNEISQLVPRAAGQPAVIRSLLRRHLQGDVQPFEHAESLNIEKGLRESHNPTPDALTPGVPKQKPAQKAAETNDFNLMSHDDNGIANFSS